jgi:hypothetical protein
VRSDRRVYNWRSEHEQLATHIQRREWFRAKGIKTIELDQKLDDLKAQSRFWLS